MRKKADWLRYFIDLVEFYKLKDVELLKKTNCPQLVEIKFLDESCEIFESEYVETFLYIFKKFNFVNLKAIGLQKITNPSNQLLYINHMFVATHKWNNCDIKNLE